MEEITRETLLKCDFTLISHFSAESLAAYHLKLATIAKQKKEREEQEMQLAEQKKQKKYQTILQLSNFFRLHLFLICTFPFLSLFSFLLCEKVQIPNQHQTHGSRHD